MPDFIVKTREGRNIIITVDKYEVSDEDDTCQDCQFETQSFFEHVWSVIDAWHEAENESAVEAADPCCCACETGTPVDVPETKDSDPYVIQHWKASDGTDWWGFFTENGFVHFSTPESAQFCLNQQLDGSCRHWNYLDLTGGKRLD
jgi:hypothetical protein